MKKYLSLAVIPLAVLVLAGCSAKKPDQSVNSKPATQTTETARQNQEESLPSEPKAAVDKEISEVDSQINATTEDIDSNELSNQQFGL